MKNTKNLIMEKCLEIGCEEIKKEMKLVGFIDNSDNRERFLDRLANELAVNEIEKLENLDFDSQEDMIDEMEEKLLGLYNATCKVKYNLISEVDERGDFEGYFTIKEFDNIEDLKKYFKFEY